jgi:hypothetical protein
MIEFLSKVLETPSAFEWSADVVISDDFVMQRL